MSWKNKYKEDEKTPKFFGSTTFFVFLTDAWHLFKFVKNTFNIVFGVSMFLVGYCYNLQYSVFLFSICYGAMLRIFGGLAFTLFFNKFLEYYDPFGIKGKQNTPSNERNSNWNPNK